MEDIAKLVNSTNSINQNISISLTLLEANKLALHKVLIDMVKKRKLILINDEGLTHSEVRFVVKGDKCFINCAGYAKENKKVSGTEYNFDLNELYELLLQGYLKINIHKVTLNRDCMNDIMNVYIELMKKPILRNNHLSEVTARNKLSFILAFYILVNTEKTAVSNAAGYAKKISDITEEDYKSLFIKYKEFERNKMSMEDMWEILQKEYRFLKDSKIDTLKYNIIYCFGATNWNMMNDISDTACIIVDYYFHNKATLNIMKNNFIKDAIKPTYYNDIINILIERA